MYQSVSVNVWCPHWKVFLVTRRGTNKTQRLVSCLAGVFFSPISVGFTFYGQAPVVQLSANTRPRSQLHSPLSRLASLQSSSSAQCSLVLASWCLSWPRCCVRLKVTVSDCEEVTATPHSVSQCLGSVVMESQLAEAVEQGDVTSVIQLLRQGADVNLAAGLHGTTALMEAAVLGNVDILTILLSCANINLNQQDLSGQVNMTHLDII